MSEAVKPAPGRSLVAALTLLLLGPTLALNEAPAPLLPVPLTMVQPCQVTVQPGSVTIQEEPVTVTLTLTQDYGPLTDVTVDARSRVEVLDLDPSTQELELDVSEARKGEWDLTARVFEITCTGTLRVRAPEPGLT